MSTVAMEKYKSPNYYVRKRLYKNKPALFGLLLISFAVFIALLGYIVLPDKTPDSNDGAPQITKHTPGFSTTFLKIRKNKKIATESFFSSALNGQESKYLIKPVSSYRIEDYTVYAKIYGQETEEAHSLINVVKPLFVGKTEKLATEDGENYVVNGDQVTYVDLDNNLIKTTRSELIAEFEENNIESRIFLFGTDMAGRDVLSRLLFGTRISLSIGFVSVLISMLLGITLGSLAGFFGGKVDVLIVWLMSVIWSIPGIMLVIAISLALQSRGVWVAFVAVGLTMWVDVARVVRGQILSIKEKLFVEAARAFGISNIRIIKAHILPNILGPLIVIATSNFASAILLEASLSFLGLSVQPPTPSWGNMIYEGYRSIGSPNSWHLVVFPGVAISLMVLSFNLLGNGLRDAYDPKTMVL